MWGTPSEIFLLKKISFFNSQDKYKCFKKLKNQKECYRNKKRGGRICCLCNSAPGGQ